MGAAGAAGRAAAPSGLGLHGGLVAGDGAALMVDAGSGPAEGAALRAEAEGCSAADGA